MTDIETVDPIQEENVEASGHDLESLLYNFLDECLFIFSADPFLCASIVNITEFDKVQFKIKALLRGEPFDLSKHPQGTEVKAITYSNMQIYEKSQESECYVIIDIWKTLSKLKSRRQIKITRPQWNDQNRRKIYQWTAHQYGMIVVKFII